MHIARTALTSLAAGLILGLVLFTSSSWASDATADIAGIARAQPAVLPFAFAKARHVAPPVRSGVVGAQSMLDSGRARLLSLATAYFDGDGMVDTVCGYGDGNGDGLGELRRGNPDSLFLNSPGALARKAANRFSDAPVERESTLVSLPTEPDFLMAGDFDGDGLQDLACASSGKSAFFVLLGNGKGGFGEPLRISLSAPLTFLDAGEVNRRDGLPELVAGLSGTEGARLVVFEGTAGAVSGTPEEIELPAEPVEVVFGRFGEDYPRDMAILLASGEVVMVQGRDRELSFDAERRAAVPCPSLVSVSLPGSAALASLSSYGSLSFIDPRRPSELLITGQAIEMASRADAEPLRARLVTIPTAGADRLVVLEGGQALLSHVVDGIGSGATAGAVSLGGSAVAILPMRLNADAFTDLLVLRDDLNDPLRVVPAAASEKVSVVNTDAYGEDAGSYADEATWDGVCATEEGACILNAAIWECAGPTGNGTCTIRFNVPASGVPSVGFRDNGDPPGTLASAAAQVKIGKSCMVRLDVYPDGLVEVLINNEKVLSDTFPNGVAPGGVGLSADKTSSVFDDFTVWDESVLPES